METKKPQEFPAPGSRHAPAPRVRELRPLRGRRTRRTSVTLDELSLHDAGVSGFSGANSTTGKLAMFLEMVKDGRIPKGSVLIVENIDRLSRLPPNEASNIITSIVKAGIDLVTLSPEQTFTAKNIDRIETWLPLQVSTCLAHAESVKKSDRLKDAWARKRTALAEGKMLR